jgi:oligoribonuclease (3'-5' exoribonuclease)
VLSKMLWLDLETDGLGPGRKILEIGAVVTDENLNALDVFHRVLALEWMQVAKLDPWPKEVHRNNGLISECLVSGYADADVDAEFKQFIDKYWKPEEMAIVAGHNVYTDIDWCKPRFPLSAARMHYRTFDISTLRMLGSKNEIPSVHRSLPDVLRDIDEFKVWLNMTGFHASGRNFGELMSMV